MSRSPKLLMGLALVILVYVFYIWGLSTMPSPGFYVDESCLAYNGYLIAHTGTSESGATLPLFIPCYTQGFTQYANPVHIYLLALMYLFVPASNLSARIWGATFVFLATLLIGVLAARVSGRRSVGIFVALTAIVTPWLFEVSRLVLETFFFPFALVLFLLCLHNAYKRKKWTLFDDICIGLTLALITYSYAIGRMLGPAFALALLLFAVNRRALYSVVKTWIVYGITLIPVFYVYFTNDDAITKRFNRLTYLSFDRPILDNIKDFVSSYVQDISLDFLLVSGDQLPRHHIAGMGEILVATFVLAVFGLILILVRHSRDPWWRFVVFGLLFSIVPGALTVARDHSLRLVAFPVFFLLLTVPAFAWLVGDGYDSPEHEDGMLRSRSRTSERVHQFAGSPVSESLSSLAANRLWRRCMLVTFLALTIFQAVLFQMQYHKVGSDRGADFDDAYPHVLNAALSENSRPIYLEDGVWGPAYMHAYWYAAVEGVDRSNFVHLLDEDSPPPGSLVITSRGKCADCETILKDGSYILYKKLVPVEKSVNSAIGGGKGKGTGQLSKPQGLAADGKGGYYVADTGNSRIEKFDAAGKFVSLFGDEGPNEAQIKEPHGIAIGPNGDIYVTDSANHKLIEFRPDGSFIKEWRGPDTGFSGPRDITLGEDNQFYIVDQGRTRIVKFDPSTEAFTTWGTAGSGEGQLNDPTGVAVGGGFVFVADAGNGRIQVFDLDGKFVRQWPTFETEHGMFPDVAFDEQSGRVFVSDGKTKQILVFDINGNRLPSLKVEGEEKLDNPTALLITEVNSKRRLLALDTESSMVIQFELETAGKQR